MGASAGLNLIADRLPLSWERGDGSPLEVLPTPPIIRRVGFDIRPLDVLDDEDARWLRASVWSGQEEREADLLEAIELFRAAQREPGAPSLVRATASSVPALLPHRDDGSVALLYQTIVRDYLPPTEWEAYRSGVYEWLATRAPGNALWVELEVTEEAKAGGPPVAITAHVRSRFGPRPFQIATCEPHPRRLEIDEKNVAELIATLRS
jgi:hypothetical protein